nr:hypothetical protein [Tanacetum cinerariifolium]
TLTEVGDFISELRHHGRWKIFSMKRFGHLLKCVDRIPWQMIKPSGGMMCQGMTKEIQTKGVIGDPIHFDTLGDMQEFVQMLANIITRKSIKLARILNLLNHVILRAARSQDTKHKESTRRTMPIETPTSSSLVSCNGLGEELVNESIVSEPRVKKPIVETSEAKVSVDKPKVKRKKFGPPMKMDIR